MQACPSHLRCIAMKRRRKGRSDIFAHGYDLIASPFVENEIGRLVLSVLGWS